MSLSVLVTGGTGVLGRELVGRLHKRAEVRVLSRRPPRGPALVQGDLETGAGLAAALEGVDAIAHCGIEAPGRPSSISSTHAGGSFGKHQRRASGRRIA
jgi:nucleoside-diphosphate-sugar epimerase